MEARLGADGILASCWLCLGGFLKGDAMKFIDASHEDLHRIFEAHRRMYVLKKAAGDVGAVMPASISSP